MSRLHRKLLVVTGKGGVGRSTLCAALGLAAARAGKRAICVELSGQHAVAKTLGLPHATYEPQRVAPGLDHRTFTAADCLADFAQRKLHLPAVSNWLITSKPMATFLDAVPGLHDLLQLGKLENMIAEPLPGEPTWDLTILDAHATGHGLTLLAAARAMRETARVGPFYELAGIIERFLSDPEVTGFVVVTLPEALPVHEALELSNALAVDHAAPAAVLVNRCAREWPDDAAADALRDALAARPEPAAQALAALADEESTRSGHQRDAREVLRLGLEKVTPLRVHTVELPDLTDPTKLDPIVDILVKTLMVGGV